MSGKKGMSVNHAKGSLYAKAGSGFYAYNSPAIRKVRRAAGLPPLHGREGERDCLRCDKKFKSLDVRKFRICDRCKRTSTWRNGDSAFEMRGISKVEVRKNLAEAKKGDE